MYFLLTIRKRHQTRSHHTVSAKRWRRDPSLWRTGCRCCARASERTNEESVEGRDSNRGCEIPSFLSLPNWVWNSGAHASCHTPQNASTLFSRFLKSCMILFVSVLRVLWGCFVSVTHSNLVIETRSGGCRVAVEVFLEYRSGCRLEIFAVLWKDRWRRHNIFGVLC